MGKSISSGTLKATLAKALHLPERKVDYPYRVVQEHGEVSRGKRGRGGAGQTPRDGATAITAVAMSFIGDEVIKGVRDFSSMPLIHTAHITHTEAPDGPPGVLSAPDGWSEISDGTWQCSGFRLPHLQQLPERHSFIDALTAVIEAARDNAFEAAIRGAYPDEDSAYHSIEVVFSGPQPSASIKIELKTNKRSYCEEAAYFVEDLIFVEDLTSSAYKASAFEISIKIDFQPIYAIAALFREGGDD